MVEHPLAHSRSSRNNGDDAGRLGRASPDEPRSLHDPSSSGTGPPRRRPASRPARPARPRTTATPGSWATTSAGPSRSGSATPTVQADAVRVRRRAGDGRHVPGRDLPRLHRRRHASSTSRLAASAEARASRRCPSRPPRRRPRRPGARRAAAGQRRRRPAPAGHGRDRHRWRGGTGRRRTTPAAPKQPAAPKAAPSTPAPATPRPVHPAARRRVRRRRDRRRRRRRAGGWRPRTGGRPGAGGGAAAPRAHPGRAATAATRAGSRAR